MGIAMIAMLRIAIPLYAATRASINVLPYSIGVEPSHDWKRQTTSLSLTGNLAQYEERVVLTQAIVGQVEPVQLVFAWTQVIDVPFIKVPFIKVPFIKVPFIKVPFMKVPFMKVPFMKVPFMKVPFIEVPFIEVPFIEVPLILGQVSFFMESDFASTIHS